MSFSLFRTIINKFLDKVRQLLPDSIRRIIRQHILVPIRRFTGPHIPIAMITGTKGKTTTTRMLAHILTLSGHQVGYCSTDGIVINGEYINTIDSSGYKGAGIVLSNPTITAAVLETARGDLLRVGLYRDRCTAAALLNVEKEQIGIDGIDNLEQMAKLKQKVINASRGVVVLNADNPQCVNLIGDYAPERVVLFSLREHNLIVQQHIQKGGSAFIQQTIEQNCYIVRLNKNTCIPVLSIKDLPSSLGGIFTQNIANAMAAAALADGMAVPLDTIKASLQTFDNSLEHSPGRFNFLDGYSQTIFLDCAVNVPACTALIKSLEKLNISERKVCMFESAGNRPDWHFSELGEILGAYFDDFICYDIKEFRRGREPGEIPQLLKKSLMDAGISANQINTALGYKDATQQLAQVVGTHDFVVILIANPFDYLPIFKEHFIVHQL